MVNLGRCALKLYLNLFAFKILKLYNNNICAYVNLLWILDMVFTFAKTKLLQKGKL